MTRVIFFISLFLAIPVFASEPMRTIAILENERMLEAEPDIRLVDYFRLPSEAIRIRALLAAARIGNPLVLTDLKALQADPSAEVRKYVAFAIGQIRSKKGLALAISLLKDSDVAVRRLAIEATGRIGGMETTSLLVPFLADNSPDIREQAALAIALVKDKGAVDVLLGRLNANDMAQWSYVYALYRLADERSIPALHQVLVNPVPSPSTGDPSSLLFALKALWSMKKPLSPPEIKQLMKHPDSRVQHNALDVIAASVDKNACATIHEKYSAMDVLTKMKALETMGSQEIKK